MSVFNKTNFETCFLRHPVITNVLAIYVHPHFHGVYIQFSVKNPQE